MEKDFARKLEQLMDENDATEYIVCMKTGEGKSHLEARANSGLWVFAFIEAMKRCIIN